MLLEFLSPLLVLLDLGSINESDFNHALTAGAVDILNKTRVEPLNAQKDEQKKLDFEVAHHQESLAGKSWQITKLKEFEDEEKRVVSIASDEDLLVVGLVFGGQARVYDVKTGELKFTLDSYQLDDMPEFVEQDYIKVLINSRNIVTMGVNDNSLTIWDRNGNMVARNLHKDKEAHKELERFKKLDDRERQAYLKEKTAGMSPLEAFHLMGKIQSGIVETDKKIMGISLSDNGKIYAGTRDGLLVIAEDNNGKWRIEEDVELGFELDYIATEGSRILVGYYDSSHMVLRLWDEKTKWFADDQKVLKVTIFTHMKFVYPYVFLSGTNTDPTGVEIWSLDTGKRVRYLLQGEREYEHLASNGKFMAICEEIHSGTSGYEIDLKLAVYNVEQLVDPRISNEDLWNFSTSYSVKDMGPERILSSFNDHQLIVNHGATKFSVFEFEE